MDTLKTRIAELCIQGDYIHGGEKFIPNLRQVNKLKTALDRMSELCWGIDNGVGDELLADDLEGAIKALEEMRRCQDVIRQLMNQNNRSQRRYKLYVIASENRSVFHVKHGGDENGFQTLF